jgi:hypothetical protein
MPPMPPATSNVIGTIDPLRRAPQRNVDPRLLRSKWAAACSHRLHVNGQYVGVGELGACTRCARHAYSARLLGFAFLSRRVASMRPRVAEPRLRIGMPTSTYRNIASVESPHLSRTAEPDPVRPVALWGQTQIVLPGAYGSAHVCRSIAADQRGPPSLHYQF